MELPVNNAMKSSLDAALQHAIAEHEIPGLTAAVTRGGDMIYAAAFGVADLDSREPVTTRSQFHLASVTKLFVATALVQLDARGKIDLQSPVAAYLPYFEMADDRYTGMTVQQMMTHTSGMPDTEEYGWETPEYDDEALERYVRSLAPLTLLWSPGERFAYSNIAYEVLGDLIAKVSGASFEEYVRQNILAPLGMIDSTLLVREADPALLVRPHTRDESGVLAVSPVFPYNRAHAPSSTLYSNVEDLSRFALANLARGALDGQRFLPENVYARMWSPLAWAGDDELWPHIGLTWFIDDKHGTPMVGHDGEDVGFTTVLALLPAADVSVTILANADSIPIEKIRDALIEIVMATES